MYDTKAMDDFIDTLYQAMFDTSKKGYNMKEVDDFIEKLKDECKLWNHKYFELQKEVFRLRELLEREGIDYGCNTSPKTGS